MTTLNLISIQDIAKNPLVVIDQMISFLNLNSPLLGY